MKDFVLDTSVIVKWFFEETNTSIALKIRDYYFDGKIELYLPDLVIYELTNVFRYGKISKDQAKDFIQDFYKMEMILIQPNQSLLFDTLNYALNFDITIYDGIFITLAKNLGTKMITADKKLYEKTKSTGLIIFLENFSFT
ncbi:MAG: type II toxin-antitoxin system VapC family toxin [Candidatus Helarchaeota archaeon]